MLKSRELREKRGVLAAQAMEFAQTDAAKFEEMMKEVDALAGQIERLERAEKLDAELRQTTRPPLEMIGNGNGNNAGTEQRAAEAKKAFRSYLVTGDAAELRTYSPMAEGGNAGYLVPQGFQYEIEEALKAFGGMRKVARILPTATGNPLPWPTSNDTGTMGEIIGENQQVSMSNPTLSAITLNAWKYSTKLVQVSRELLQDSAFDIEAYLKGEFVKRIGRITNNHFTVGTGTSQPKGVVTAATAGPTATTSGAVIYDDLVNLEHSVDPDYREGAKFMLADSTLKVIKKLKDSIGRPLWQPGVSAGIGNKAPDTILGYEYVVNQDMPAIGTGNAFIAFGAFDKYVIRVVRELSVLRLDERYAEYGQVGFIGFARFDGNLLDAGTHPVMTLIGA